MSRKIPLYLTDEEEKEFLARYVEAVTLLQRDVSPKELIVKHLNRAYKLPIREVMQ